jgi:phenylpropionate dioxygenase-like ring-hydroxylating dioxygenase large terminal subunit
MNAPTPKKRYLNRIPVEGENGLYTQSWFAICRSEDLPADTVVGREFLGGRVVVFRDAEGVAHVKSAYCPHLGADLSIGEVVDGELRCAFHHWRYDKCGDCVATGIGDPPPPTARLFSFPTREKYGVIFAFNGTKPLFELADFELPPERAAARVTLMPMQADPWTFCANVPDFQHFIMVHRMLRDDLGQYDRIDWSDHGLSFAFTAYPELGKAPPVPFRVSVQGTALILVQGALPDGRWFGTAAAMSLPRARSTEIFIIVAIENGAPDEETVLAQLTTQFVAMAEEDHELLERAHYQPGTLTRQDQALGRYLAMVRGWPRAHPAADFIG